MHFANHLRLEVVSYRVAFADTGGCVLVLQRNALLSYLLSEAYVD